MSLHTDAVVFVLEPDDARRTTLTEQLGWRGFRVVGVAEMPAAGPPADATFLVFCGDDPAAVVAALPPRSDKPIVVCAPPEVGALRAALRAGVCEWLDRDADPGDVAAPLFEAEDDLEEQGRARALARALEALPLPVVVADESGRVLASSTGAPRVRRGEDAAAALSGDGFTRTPLPHGGAVWAGEAAGTSGADSVRLAEVHALVAQAVHDINNISTYVTNNLISLEEDIPPHAIPADDRALLTESVQGTQQATNVVRRLRAAVSDLTSGHVGPVEIAGLVAEAGAAVEAQGFAVVTVDAPETAVVRADAARLGRLLGAAFLQTARQSAHVGDGPPPVEAQVRVMSDRVRVRLVAEGAGPDEAAGAAAFRSFFKDPGATGPAPWNLALAGTVLGEIGGDLRFVDEPGSGRWLELTVVRDDLVPL